MLPVETGLCFCPACFSLLYRGNVNIRADNMNGFALRVQPGHAASSEDPNVTAHQHIARGIRRKTLLFRLHLAAATTQGHAPCRQDEPDRSIRPLQQRTLARLPDHACAAIHLKRSLASGWDGYSRTPRRRDPRIRVRGSRHFRGAPDGRCHCQDFRHQQDNRFRQDRWPCTGQKA